MKVRGAGSGVAGGGPEGENDEKLPPGGIASGPIPFWAQPASISAAQTPTVERRRDCGLDGGTPSAFPFIVTLLLACCSRWRHPRRRHGSNVQAPKMSHPSPAEEIAADIFPVS